MAARVGDGYGLPRFSVAPQVGDMDSHASLWLLELGLWTPTLQCGPWSWGYGLPHFGVAPQVAGMDSHTLVWPLELGIWTPMLRCGPSRLGYGLPRFSVTSRVGSMDSHVAHVHGIEHRNRERYLLLTRGNFWIYLVMGLRYGLVGLVQGL